VGNHIPRPPGRIGSLVIRYESSQAVTAADEPRQWFLAIETVDEHGDTSDTIGHVIAYAVDHGVSDLPESSHESPDLAHITRVLAAEDDLPGTGLLVIDAVRLKPRWRDHGVETLAVGMAIGHLAADCRLVALRRRPGESDLVATRLGFRPVGEGVWTLFPRRDHVAEVMGSVRAELGLA
jgi:hypothetical protein